jgi:hypothetical protein
LAQRRKANSKYQASRAARLDHADRQRAYIERWILKPKKMTGQGSDVDEPSATVDSSRKPEQQAQQKALHAKSHFPPASQEASSYLVFCIVCGRSAFLPAPMPRSP